ncbi:MAG: FAD-linked oxidase C-terminal domain-containing protein [Lautropia sp.]|nr:FAD-linked oxidase C-terminal domain-containing protein [Lautropia sp.]
MNTLQTLTAAPPVVPAAEGDQPWQDTTVPLPPERLSAVLDGLKQILPMGSVLWREEDVRPYECDGLSAYRQLPPVVVLPDDEAQVQAIIRLCRAQQVPLVPRGAGTGLTGSAMPHAGGVLMSMARFNRVLSLDPVSRTARVQPGVRNLAISEAAAACGLFYAPDPSSQIACTIGGNVAENSGGVHCLKYGLTVHNVLAMRGFTIEGEALTLGPAVRDGGVALDAPGLDLLGLNIGSEGMLAVITEVVVKLLPTPQVAQVIMASFDAVETAGDAVAAVIAAGLIPAGMEMMDRQATAAVEPFVKAGYDLEAAAILLVESDGTPEEVAEEVAQMEAVLRQAGATRLQVSTSEAERMRFWSGRKNAFPAAGRISADYYCMDGTIPKRSLGRMLLAIADMERKYGLRCMNVFHAGDGNLHPLILFDSAIPGEWDRAEKFGAEILELCVALGGTITGEHGVGIEKINSMCVQFSPEERAAFFAVKRAFDQPGLLNPGKAIPTLHRCAEYGRMHVRQGCLRFPELPRF